MNSAKRAPMKIEPRKIKQKSIAEKMISSKSDLSFSPILSTVSYITMPIASLKIDSPKMIEYKFTSASISLKTARTETGSVALIKLPNAKASFQLKSGENSV